MAPDPACNGDLVTVERPEAGLAIVTLNRPEALNALSGALRRDFVAAIRALSTDPTIRALIVTGAGRGFCAGLDLKELGADSRQLASIGADDPVAALRAFPGVAIGAINGPAITGGFELALACDILIASERARFADTHARVGVLPGWQLSQRLSRTIGLYRAQYHSLTGEPISAAQAADWGLVSRLVPHDALMDTARAAATAILAGDAATVAALKALIANGYVRSLEDGMALELARSAAHNEGIAAGAIARRRDAILSRGRGDAESRIRDRDPP